MVCFGLGLQGQHPARSPAIAPAPRCFYPQTMLVDEVVLGTLYWKQFPTANAEGTAPLSLHSRCATALSYDMRITLTSAFLIPGRFSASTSFRDDPGGLRKRTPLSGRLRSICLPQSRAITRRVKPLADGADEPPP